MSAYNYSTVFTLQLLPNSVASAVIVLVGVFTIIVAVGFTAIRKWIYKDKDNFDLAFDAGGKVSIGLTATTIVSQWTWAATLLQSAAVGSKYGISGPFWYAAGASVQILLFSALSVKLKIHAPGAKSFLQVIRRRFGKTAHKVYCVYALLTNVIVMAMLMLGGASTIVSIVDGYSLEMVSILTTGIIFAYTMIGGLGATFYASYFNTAFYFVGIYLYAYYVFFKNTEDVSLGSFDKVYTMVQNLTGPAGNEGQSYLTMVSQNGLMFGIINIIGNFGTVFVDQAYWQSSVAARPKDGVFGFMIGGLVWFAIPFTFATVMGIGYLSISSGHGGPLLTDNEVNAGLVPAAVASYIGGYTMLIVLLIMLLMAVTSTGSAEVIAVGSILVYDIYMVYLKPFRATFDANTCLLCGKAQGRKRTTKDKCTCESIATCKKCADDDQARLSLKRALKPEYTCRTHGQYRRYQDLLGDKKSWCIMWSALGIIPLTFMLNMTGITLGWLYLFMGVLIGSAVIPVGIALFWDRLTGLGMAAGPVAGTILGVTAWLIEASTFPGGLNEFFLNTGQEWSMLVGNLVSIFCGGLVTILVSFFGTLKMEKLEREEIWETTLDIDNPLYPWTELYKTELKLQNASKLDSRPSLLSIEKAFRFPQKVAIFGSALLTVILIVVWPLAASLCGVFTQAEFTIWIIVSIAWGVVAGLVIIVVPVHGEVVAALNHIREHMSSVGPK